MTPATRRLLFGTDQQPPRALNLRAGRLTARLQGTRLGPVFFDGHEVWHGADFLYRDEAWGTPEYVIDAIEHQEAASGFLVRVRGHVPAAGPLDFHVTLEAREREMRYEAVATPRGDVATNRTGVVLLHPQSVAGTAVEIEHVDGRISTSTFPALIAPWPPFTLVRAIRHEYAEGAWATCRFSGDDFELEDQRNNADASFKTYSRSNLMPRPYVLGAGKVVRQALELRIEGDAVRAAPAGDRPVRVRVTELAGPLPAIGTAIASADAHEGEAERAGLRLLAPKFLHLALDRPDGPIDAPAVARLLQDAGTCALRLDVCAVDPHRADAQLGRIAQALAFADVRPEEVAVFPSLQIVLDAARRAFPFARIGGGTPHYFTQLNRVEDLGAVDFLTFTTAAVVHGADDHEIMSGLNSLPAMFATLRARHGNRPVHVGPSSIGALRSPFGAPTASDGTRRLALARNDPRTSGLYGAAWTVGAIAQLAGAGAQAVTLFGLGGDAALIRHGQTTPAFEVMRQLGATDRWRGVEITAPAAIAAVALDQAGITRLLLAELNGGSHDIVIEDLEPDVQARVMDAESLQARAAAPHRAAWRPVAVSGGTLRLGPYGVALV